MSSIYCVQRKYHPLAIEGLFRPRSLFSLEQKKRGNAFLQGGSISQLSHTKDILQRWDTQPAPVKTLPMAEQTSLRIRPGRSNFSN